MLSTAEANENAKFFTHHWTMTTPANPSLKYIHITVSHLDEWLALISNPANKPYDKTAQTKLWDDAAIEEWKTSTAQKLLASQSKFNALNMLIQYDGRLVGATSCSLLPTGEVNLGLLLTQDARGRGIGKLSMQVLIQLAHNMGIKRLEAGTMKANQPMRALMASLKIPGRDEIKEAPGRGVVAEVLYTIPDVVDWEDIDLRVDFGALASE